MVRLGVYGAVAARGWGRRWVGYGEDYAVSRGSYPVVEHDAASCSVEVMVSKTFHGFFGWEHEGGNLIGVLSLEKTDPAAFVGHASCWSASGRLLSCWEYERGA